ncbi:MAG: tetratricopeptide repeat protein [Iphinoe sp. HA4291-MV1]|nr:tetratricopeptide repeat protein [Iphinoe sp. HA4291-MV1]
MPHTNFVIADCSNGLRFVSNKFIQYPLAGLYDSQGRYTEAEPLYIKALELRQRLPLDEHPSIASSYNNLAGLYDSQGRYTEAEPLYIKALEIAERSLGVNHPNTIIFRENLQFLRDNRQS